MTDYFSVERWLAVWGNLVDWVIANVLVVDNAVQLLIAAFAFAAAIVLSRRVIPWLEKVEPPKGLRRIVRVVVPLTLPLIWLVIQWLCISAATTMQWPSRVLEIIASLLAAWIVIRLVSQMAQQPIWATAITWVAWSIAALNILDLLGPTITILDSAAINIGSLRISLFTVAQSTIALAVLLSIAVYLTGILEARIKTSTALSPSVQVLFAKSLKIVLIGLAIIIAIRSVGIDLTALAVLGGAIGLGIGFGLQKIISNLISGVILLVDKSIKPGDVIAVAGTYGWVTALGGRYVSVVTRDGVEHLIPNETLISERVENWTHTNSQTRLKVDVGVHYNTDLPKAMDLCVAATNEVDRVLKEPGARCLLIEFGDNSLNLQIRFWIADAHNGIQNVKSAVLLNIWHKFKESGVEIPYPQRDVHIRTPGHLFVPAPEPNAASSG